MRKRLPLPLPRHTVRYGTGALRLPAWGIAAGTLLILLIGYAAAVFTGHWEADLPRR